MSKTQAIFSEGAPKPIGPYSQATASQGFVFCSGQIPLDPATGALVSGDIAVQTKRVLDNLEAVLKAAGSSFSQVVKLTVFLVDLKDFGVLNQVLDERLKGLTPPARSVVQVSALPKGASLEIEAVAVQG